MTKPPLKGEDGATAPEGFPAVRRIPFRMSQGEFVQSRMEIVRIRLRLYMALNAYRKTPLRLAKSRLTAVARLHGACASHKSGPRGLTAQLCIKQLYAIL